MSNHTDDAEILQRVEKKLGWFRQGAIMWSELMAQICEILLIEKRLDLAAPTAELFAKADHAQLRAWAEKTIEDCGDADMTDILPDAPYIEKGTKSFTYHAQPAALAELARGMLTVLPAGPQT